VERPIRVEMSPRGRGAGEQWVRERYPRELQGLRAAGAETALLVVADADRLSREEREKQLREQCQRAGIELREPGEPVAHFFPARNIETWIAWLGGATVNEASSYPRLPRERECAPQVKRLAEHCAAKELPEDAPPSLQDACTEWDARIRSRLGG
jgi:hypothetical protein